MKFRIRFHCFALVAISLFMFGCPPDGPGEGMGEGAGEGMGEGAGEGMGEGAGEGMGETGIQDAAGRFFVDAARGDDGNSGLRADPLETIQAAIDRAATEGGMVYVAGGTYSETVTLASAVEVRGGYDSTDWTVDRENFPSMIAGGTTAVVGETVTDALLEGFIVLSADATDPGGTSLAVSLNDCMDIVLQDVVLFPGNGANGAEGAEGVPGDRGPAGGNGGGAAACGTEVIPGGLGGRLHSTDPFRGGDGGSGRLGPGGDGGPGTGLVIGIAAGGAGGAGGGVGGDGTPGGDGANGTFGATGEGGLSVGRFAAHTYRPAEGGHGMFGQIGGAGGGGGGGGGAIVFACGGSGGGGGGSGESGSGGIGGMGGGASIGLLVTNSIDVRVTDCMIGTGDGGMGGRGGTGGAGGIGGDGGSGGARFGGQGAGGDGGDGGNGGPGGEAGGGGGGPVLGIVHDADSTVTQSNTDIALGAPGLGGISNQGMPFFGADGLAMETYAIPDDGAR